MIAGIEINDINNHQLSGKYLMIDELNWATNVIIRETLERGVFEQCDLDTPLIERVIRLDAIEHAIFAIGFEIGRGDAIIMNCNGGYHTYNKKNHIILNKKEFNNIYEEYKVAISWLRRCRYESEDIYYPYLCGILLNTGTFIYCKYGEHKYISQYLLENNIDTTNAIVIGSHPKVEYRSYVHIEGTMLPLQIDFLKKNIVFLNNIHKDFLNL